MVKKRSVTLADQSAPSESIRVEEFDQQREAPLEIHDGLGEWIKTSRSKGLGVCKYIYIYPAKYQRACTLVFSRSIDAEPTNGRRNE